MLGKLSRGYVGSRRKLYIKGTHLPAVFSALLASFDTSWLSFADMSSVQNLIPSILDGYLLFLFLLRMVRAHKVASCLY